MKASTKILKTVKLLQEKKDEVEMLKKQISQLEETMIKVMGNIATTTVEDEEKVYSITLGENVRNKLSEEGKRAIVNIPYESDVWENKPNITAIMNDKELKQYVIRTEYRKKVLVTEKEKEK